MLTRRRMLMAGATALAGLRSSIKSSGVQVRERNEDRGIPLVHITDLYHPPQDPDDHIDLATVVALKEFDLKAVILDVTGKFLVAAPVGFDKARDPGVIPVLQLAYLLGRPIPVAAGPHHPLHGPDDDARDRPRPEQAGIALLLDILKESDRPVVLSIVGSARVLTASFNRNPELVRSKIQRVLLNAGSTSGPKQEWNVGLDPAAYVGLWRSGLPIDWYPCATQTGAFNPEDERGTYWKASHAELFRKISDPLRAWFAYSFTGSSRGDIIRFLQEDVSAPVWEKMLLGERNLWSTSSLAMAAGRILARTPQGWRFVPASDAGDEEIWPWQLDPIEATVDATGDVRWRTVSGDSPRRLFSRRRGSQFGRAMAEALNALLVSIPF